jgi:hypothetical protein
MLTMVAHTTMMQVQQSAPIASTTSSTTSKTPQQCTYDSLQAALRHMGPPGGGGGGPPQGPPGPRGPGGPPAPIPAAGAAQQPIVPAPDIRVMGKLPKTFMGD